MRDKYLVIDKQILPDIFQKVIDAKELLRTGKVKEVTEAVKSVGISRSAFYKYKDYVFTLSEERKGKKVTLFFLLNHEAGVLSNILNLISSYKGNILTINQDIPINNVANVSITFDISDIEISVEDIFSRLKEIKGVDKVELIGME
ncbi:ACT domain-containing protein [Clostridium sp. SYSU_GA19001]|uniref:ACT domain-containing protein n=1 Tax=Clostridium caldaquaticum TaxID=2940653 RepID=UPI002077914E|nr:ACT domain-containing protein [Clostridium caldaquaticum]MCM8709796.1 ACT domain-containing protein [Clostridium caldaquaticum]